MDKISLKILGSGSSLGIPMIGCFCDVCTSDNPKNKRLRCSSLIKVRDKKILIDTSPDLRQQLQRENISDVDAIILTHFHADHLLGIDEVRGLCFSNRKTYRIYANQETIDEISHRFSYLLKLKFNDQPVFELIPVEEYSDINLFGLKIKTFNIQHGKLTCLGLRINDLVYAVDIQSMPEKSIEVIRNADTIIMDATAPERVGIHQGFPDAIALSKAANIRKTFFTHISHHADCNYVLEEGFELAYDGMELTGY